MIDKGKLSQDAYFILDAYDHPALHNVARMMLSILAKPELVIPEGHAIVKRPELLGKGVPSRP